MTTQPSESTDIHDAPPTPAEQMTPEELCELFDRNARYWLGVTGEQFRQRWQAGEYANEQDEMLLEGIETMQQLLPLVEGSTISTSERCRLVEMASDLPLGEFLTREEAIELFDQNARYWLGISGEEFRRRWEAGEYVGNDDWPDHSAIINVYMTMPRDR